MAQRGRSTGRQPGRSAPARATTPPRLPAVDLASVKAVIEPAIVQAGYELEHLSVKAVGKRHLARIVIDGDGGLGLDVIAEVSRAISKALDDDDPFPGEYQLEVSSPGVDRLLTTAAHWRRNAGRMVKVKVAEKTLTGRLTAANDQGVTLEVEGVAHRLRLDELGPGRVQIEFSRMDEISDEDMAEFDDGEPEEKEEER